MKDELISAETFEIAKQKGFIKKGHFFNEDIIIPTQSLLQKWLREVHEIDVNIQQNFLVGHNRKYCLSISSMNKNYYHRFYDKEYGSYKTEIRLDTYELALEEGLKEGLKLIK